MSAALDRLGTAGVNATLLSRLASAQFTVGALPAGHALQVSPHAGLSRNCMCPAWRTIAMSAGLIAAA